MERQQDIWTGLSREMAGQDIHILSQDDLSEIRPPSSRKTRFLAEIFPILTPLAIDPAHPLPVHPQHRLCARPRVRERR